MNAEAEYRGGWASHLFDSFPGHVEPPECTEEEASIKLWSIIKFEEFIQKIGWIEHTSDWDLAFEVTVKDGRTYFAGSILPLLADGTEYTEDTGINNVIKSINVGDYNIDGEDYEEMSAANILISDIVSILLTR